jgi:hypothetical protein
VGIENLEDLLSDLSQAFDLAAHPGVVNVRSVRRRDTADEEGLQVIARGGSGGGGAGGGESPQSPVHWEDAASVAKAECVRLSGVNAVLRERLMQVEAAAAALEAQRRAAGGGGAPAPAAPPAAPPAGLSVLQALGVALAAAAAVAVLVRRPPALL